MVATGTLWCKGADGTEKELKAGDCYVMEPGHDIKVIGDEAVTMYEIESVIGDAKAAAGGGTTYMGSGDEGVSALHVQNIDTAPSKKMEMDKGLGCVCMMGSAKGMKATLQPGWTWKTGARPMLPADKQDLDRCPARHVGFVLKASRPLPVPACATFASPATTRGSSATRRSSSTSSRARSPRRDDRHTRMGSREPPRRPHIVQLNEEVRCRAPVQRDHPRVAVSCDRCR
jgi:hypothetical protein